MPIDRPDILINMQVLGKDHLKHKELKFLVQDPNTFIPKTIIYLEKIMDCRKVWDYLKDFFRASGWIESQLSNLIHTYYSELNKEQKKVLNSELTRPDSKHHIFIATDALGMGVNSPDIAYIIQLGTLRSSIRSLWQQAGRTVRGKDIKNAKFICFFLPELKGPLLEDLLKECWVKNTTLNKQAERDAQKCSNLP